MSAYSPYIFDEFFTSGLEESVSPFLTPNSRRWAKHLSLKSSLVSALLLLCAFIASFYHVALSNLLLTGVFFLSGTPALIDTIEDLRNFEVNIDILMTLAAFLSVLIGSQLEGGLLLVLFALSGAMEDAVSSRSKSALQNLNRLSPTMATVVDEAGGHFQKSVREIEVGVHLLIKAGEIVPLDGVVTEGHSFVNLVHLTGESVPVSKKKEDEVQAGSRNLDGSLTMRVTKTSSESTLSRIIQLIHQAQAMKPKVERFLEKFEKRYAMTIIGLSFLFAIFLPIFFSMAYLGVEGSIYRALTFLIAASPCALIIATPTAYLSAISSCAKNGILLKGGVTLDALARCKTIAFDKTGTLTTGKLSCTEAEVLRDDGVCSLEEAIGIAFSLERNVKHPIAEAICDFASGKQLTPAKITAFESVAGYGVKGETEIQGKTYSVFLGNQDFIKEEVHEDIRKEGHLLTFLIIGSSLYAFHFLDTIRPKMAETLKTLKEKLNLKLIMLTGDHQESAKVVANELGIDDFFADLRPDHKLETVDKLASECGLAMVGDGINDAPALARATVGISMGKVGSATAIDASDIVLLHDELSLLSFLIKKAHKTLRIVKENLSLALGVIFLATTPALLGFIPLWLAVVLHEGGTVLVGLNSLRLLKK